MSEESTHVSRFTRRYWRRTGEPRSLWPGGLLPLLGLVLVFATGAAWIAPDMQRDVDAEVRSRLTSAGIDVADITVSGQAVAVTAYEPDDEARIVDALARSTMCDTWAGDLTCPTTVSVSLLAPAVEAAPERPHDFLFSTFGDSITLAGEVPSADARERIVDAARDRYATVNDELRVTDALATAEYDAAATRALSVLGAVGEGEARWTQAALHVSGLTETDRVAVARERFDNRAGAPTLGTFDVRALLEADDCNAEFDRLLSASTIRFRTASADIDSGNDALLENLAEVAGRCDGSLVIGGHTDSQGDADANQRLSLLRADAVKQALVDLGLESDRLVAAGFGETQPVADNSTAEGRARNRRIVITVDNNN